MVTTHLSPGAQTFNGFAASAKNGLMELHWYDMTNQTLTAAVRVLGADHPQTLASRSNLAAAYEVAGDLDRAIPLQEQTLADRLRILGEDHPDTLTSRNNLAERVRVLGEDHPQTLTSRNNLATAHRSAGNLDRAAELLQQTLADTVRVIGKEHPLTRTVRANLDSANAKRDRGGSEQT